MRPNCECHVNWCPDQNNVPIREVFFFIAASVELNVQMWCKNNVAKVNAAYVNDVTLNKIGFYQWQFHEVRTKWKIKRVSSPRQTCLYNFHMPIIVVIRNDDLTAVNFAEQKKTITIINIIFQAAHHRPFATANHRYWDFSFPVKCCFMWIVAPLCPNAECSFAQKKHRQKW